ncbi:MAG TPA: nucleotide disphospho-sugar-binding domain-containing protein [Gracilimonas sp.]|nr:nucleotide disphospho-sugar-binding domain-containing protein [Gracilimonas sp.]HKL16053.1 nucleotide disphospho-sugar-binding domain-containing protein [Balneolaceae bacterium]HMB41152.1 nucleotide disphospho-sugar-binding domain-containing protein [Balneolaceae bacterium]
MKTALIYTSPACGHLYPMMDVAIELRSKGYDVIVQTLSGETDHVENEEIKHLSINSEIESLKLKDYRENNPFAQIKSSFSSWLSRAPFEIEDLKKSYSQYNPDLLIVDANTWGAGAFAEAQNRPWVMFMPYCLPIPSPDTPAFGPGFPPPVNALHRLRDRVFNGIVQRYLKGIVEKLNELRSELQVSQLNTFSDIYYKPDLLIYRTAEPFEYARRHWPENILTVGPGLWAPPGRKPKWINDLPSPKILISLSTELQNDGAIIETALRALADEKGSVIVTTSAMDPENFEVPHQNVHITRFLPHAQVIPDMDLVITHGGMGTTQRALASGVPVCVIPWGRDQSETGRRVELSGCGTMLPKSKLSEKRLKSAIDEAIGRKEEANMIAQAFKKAGGAKRAVEAIDNLMPAAV